MNKQFKYRLKCPYCGRGEILADARSLVCVSVFCTTCGNLFYASLHTMRTYRSKEIERIRNIRPFYVRLPCPREGCCAELRANGEADVKVLLRCPKRNCHHFYIADLGTLETVPCNTSA